jgi:hypothetical protein
MLSKRTAQAKSYRLAASAQRDICSSTTKTLQTPSSATGVGEASPSSPESLGTWSVKLANPVKTTLERSPYLTCERDLQMSVSPREYISEPGAF